MELLGGRSQYQDCHIRSQRRIEGALERRQAMLPIGSEGDDLALSVDSPVCPTSAHHPRPMACYRSDCPFDLSLNSPFPCLDLEAVKVGPVVFDFGPDSLRNAQCALLNAQGPILPCVLPYSTNCSKAMGEESPRRMPILYMRV